MKQALVNLWSFFGSCITIVDSLFRNFKVGGLTLNFLYGGISVELISIKFRDDMEIEVDYNEEENKLRVDIGALALIRGRLKLEGLDGKTATIYTNYFRFGVTIDFNSNLVTCCHIPQVI